MMHSFVQIITDDAMQCMNDRSFTV